MIPETASTEYPGKPNWITTLYTDAIPTGCRNLALE
jgi:hypothetical protein